jgi:POT family proton-dependent oligopeptide transporter
MDIDEHVTKLVNEKLNSVKNFSIFTNLNFIKTMENKSQNGHPKGLWYLFGTEMWERFGYYLMLGIFSLYMVDGWNNGGMGFDAAKKSDIYGTYLGLVYLTPFIGGLLADRILGYRRSIVIGGLMMSAGYFMLSLHTVPSFYLALFFIILGNGFFKPNISTLVGNLYSSDEMKDKKDAGYNIFYMGINIGAFICNFVAAFMRINYGWGYAFAAAGVGMLVGVVIFLLGTKHIKHVDVVKPVEKGDMSTVKILGLTVVPMFIFGVIGYLIPGNFLGSDTNDAFIIGCLPVIAFFIYLAFTAEAKESRAIKALLAVFTCVILFFAIFHQNGDALTVWAEDHTNRNMSEGVAKTADKIGMAIKIENSVFVKDGGLPYENWYLYGLENFPDKTEKDRLLSKDFKKKSSTIISSLNYNKNSTINLLPSISKIVISDSLNDKINQFTINKDDNVKRGLLNIYSTPKSQLPDGFSDKDYVKKILIDFEKENSLLIKENFEIEKNPDYNLKKVQIDEFLEYRKNKFEEDSEKLKNTISKLKDYEYVEKEINLKLLNKLKFVYESEINDKNKIDKAKIFIYEKNEKIINDNNLAIEQFKFISENNEFKNPVKPIKDLKLYSTELYQSINPFWVVVLTPVVVGFFGFMRRKKKEPSTPTKIAIGLIITALSALVMVGAVFATNGLSAKAGSLWLFASYGVITIGELCLSPMGLSLVSKLSPPRITALMMGGFFLAISVGNKLSGMLSSLWETIPEKQNFFLLNFGLVLAAAVVLILMLKWLNKVMRENNVI